VNLGGIQNRIGSIEELIKRISKEGMCSNCRKSNHAKCYGMVRLPHGGRKKLCKCKICEKRLLSK
jgi:hypothetical protein